jgi:hypothetical protein
MEKIMRAILHNSHIEIDTLERQVDSKDSVIRAEIARRATSPEVLIALAIDRTPMVKEVLARRGSLLPVQAQQLLLQYNDGCLAIAILASNSNDVGILSQILLHCDFDSSAATGLCGNPLTSGYFRKVFLGGTSMTAALAMNPHAPGDVVSNLARGDDTAQIIASSPSVSVPLLALLADEGDGYTKMAVIRNIKTNRSILRKLRRDENKDVASSARAMLKVRFPSILDSIIKKGGAPYAEF